jgi:hypothetical protein
MAAAAGGRANFMVDGFAAYFMQICAFNGIVFLYETQTLLSSFN